MTVRLKPDTTTEAVSGRQLLTAVMCGLIVFVDGYDAQAMGYVAPALSAALHIPRSVLGPVISSGLVGMMFGAIVSGSLADRIGRRPVLIACALVFGVGSLLTATAESIQSMVIFRALTGLGMGGAMPNAIALTSETMPHRLRGTAVTTMICGFSLGAAVGGFVAASIIPSYGWQSVFVLGGSAPIAIAIAAFRWLPDSKRAAAAGSSVAQLFTDGRGVATLLIWVIYFANLLNLYFLNSWLPTIMNDAGIPVATAIRLTALFQVGGIGGAIVLGFILDRVFSFWVLAACYLWAAIAVFLIGASGASPMLLGVAIASAGLGIIGGQNGGHAVTADFYPPAIRSTGVGWALGIGRIGSITGPVLGGLLLAQGTAVHQVFWAAAIPALIATMAAGGIALRMRRAEASASA